MDTNLEDLKHIRSMMERSSKFLSLSGMSGVSAGLVALAGAWIAHSMIKGSLAITGNLKYDLIILAIVVIAGAAIVGFYFCARKAKKNGSRLWLPVTYQVLADFMIPMIVGGLFCLILLYHSIWLLIVPSMLIFYGLALIVAGERTYKDIKILGACEIVLGFIAAVVDWNNIALWAIGFGLMHIIYGLVMHFKYDAKTDKKN